MLVSLSDSLKNERPAVQTFLRLLKTSKPYWFLFTLGVIGTLLMSLIESGFSWMIKPIVNEGFIARDTHFIRWLPLVVVIAFVLRGAASFMSNYFIGCVSRYIVMDYRRDLFNHYMKIPASFYDGKKSGTLLSTLLYNVEQVAQASSDTLVDILRESSALISLVFVMFAIDWRLSAVFFLIMPILSWIFHVSSRRMRRLSKTVQSTMGELTQVAKEGIESFRLVRLFGALAYEKNKFDGVTNHNRQQEMKVIVTNSMSTAMIQAALSVPIALILFIAINPRSGFSVSAGSFAAISSAMLMLLRPIRRLTLINNKIQRGITGAASVFELLDHPPEPDRGTQTLSVASGGITLKSVSFRYPETDTRVLRDVSCQVRPGQTLAIVGKSGSGKSTFVNLLPRFYDVDEGNIILDGHDIRDYRLTDLRKQFAFVTQHTILFNDTVARNIAYGDAEIDYAKLKRAALRAHALEFIENLPNGFETHVGDDGLLLSGGQRQRLAIARALYKEAPILVLDEATSALDSHSEREIQNAFDSLMHQQTTIVIAHRLSTIENADWILVMDQGAVIEEGTHQTLLAQEGSYAELYRMQFGEEAVLTEETL